jgi:hypothetical protein
MRSCHLFSAVLAIAASVQAQSQSLAITSTPRFSSIGDVQPTATETASGPIQTGQACAEVADLVTSSRSRFPSVNAEVGEHSTRSQCFEPMKADRITARVCVP